MSGRTLFDWSEPFENDRDGVVDRPVGVFSLALGRTFWGETAEQRHHRVLGALGRSDFTPPGWGWSPEAYRRFKDDLQALVAEARGPQLTPDGRTVPELARDTLAEIKRREHRGDATIDDQLMRLVVDDYWFRRAVESRTVHRLQPDGTFDSAPLLLADPTGQRRRRRRLSALPTGWPADWPVGAGDSVEPDKVPSPIAAPQRARLRGPRPPRPFEASQQPQIEFVEAVLTASGKPTRSLRFRVANPVW